MSNQLSQPHSIEEFKIEEWNQAHPRWSALSRFVDSQGQTRWAETEASWHISSHFLVASSKEDILGFLRFVIQVIGIEEDHEPITRAGVPLTEAKILAFAVDPSHRRQGIGRALQQQALNTARRYGCYQARSHSSGSNVANHRLKLSMGFGVQPIIRDEDKGGVYFIMPLAQ